MKPLDRWLAAGLACLAAPATAQQPSPNVQPTRDVTVSYRIDGPATGLIPGGLHGPVHLSWDAAGQRVRAEADGRTQIALVNLRSHTGQVLDTSLRLVLPLAIKARDLQPLTLEGARLVPQGAGNVAGLACARYSFQSSQGPGTVCLTPDGIPLEGEGSVQGRPGRFTALSVVYGRIPPARFEVPPGFMSLGGAGDLAGVVQRLGGGASLGGLLGPTR